MVDISTFKPSVTMRGKLVQRDYDIGGETIPTVYLPEYSLRTIVLREFLAWSEEQDQRVVAVFNNYGTAIHFKQSFLFGPPEFDVDTDYGNPYPCALYSDLYTPSMRWKSIQHEYLARERVLDKPALRSGGVRG